MGRKNNRNYYDHDDRTSSGSTNIRKVSFMNGSGTIKKNKRHDQLLVHYAADDDIVMRRADRQSLAGNISRRKRNFKRREVSPAIRNSHSIKPLRPSDWYQVKIVYGAKYDKKTVLQLLTNHLQPTPFVASMYMTNGRDSVFYVDDLEVAKRLRDANRKIYFADGFSMETRVREKIPPSLPVDEKMKEKIKLAMANRYIAENKALNLTKFAFDPAFEGEMYCPLSRPPIMRVVWQIINENISDLVALNLSNNKISVLDDMLSMEAKKLKNLKILHLGDNKLKNHHQLNCFKPLELTELVLKKNPLTFHFKDNAHYVRYDRGVTEIRKKFPKLVRLDDMELPPVISFDVTEEGNLPTPQPAFMCNPEGRGMVQAFLTQYFAIYDSENRLELAQAYHDNSTFSLCAYYPPNQRPNVNFKLSSYLPESRNLFKLPDFPRRKSKLQMGKQIIVQFLSQLPKSQHDLSSFVVDLILFTPALINLCVNGVFREPTFSAPPDTWPVRHFSRTFLIVPVGQGFCIINDMLLLTNATDDEVQCFFKEKTSTSMAATTPTSPQPGPSAASPVSHLDDSVRLQMVQTLATKTGMNLEWSKKCLDETQWDFDRAIWTFTELQSKGSIPAEAFVK